MQGRAGGHLSPHGFDSLPEYAENYKFRQKKPSGAVLSLSSLPRAKNKINTVPLQFLKTIKLNYHLNQTAYKYLLHNPQHCRTPKDFK